MHATFTRQTPLYGQVMHVVQHKYNLLHNSWATCLWKARPDTDLLNIKSVGGETTAQPLHTKRRWAIRSCYQRTCTAFREWLLNSERHRQIDYTTQVCQWCCTTRSRIVTSLALYKFHFFKSSKVTDMQSIEAASVAQLQLWTFRLSSAYGPNHHSYLSDFDSFDRTAELTR